MHQHQLKTLDQVRAVIGDLNPAIKLKIMTELNETAIGFIRRAPFLVIATVDADGQPDISPKGDNPGFVAVESPTSLLIPDRKGNRLIMTLQNILANPRVALFFTVPGTEETLRVYGTVELTADPEVLQRLSARGQPALLAMRVAVEKCFFHCAKAFKRSQLWHPETWLEPQKISFGDMLAKKLGSDATVAKQIDEAVERDYKENL